ncbi:Maf-like protein YceF [Gammaproteobacteria bacterium MOLA455]|nr:Maf-like protein YceF [Gammaproteobacteria bacterium MOLA455]
MHNLILASSSAYKKSLLERLQISFTCASPDIDERAHANESPQDQAVRLASEKAQAVAAEFPQATVIGADQVAELCTGEPNSQNPNQTKISRLLGKPGNHQQAIEQLSAQSGHLVKFYTAVTVLNQGLTSSALDITEVRFRDLSSTEIEAYLIADTPYDCAGSFKAESLGVSLFESVTSVDPSALIGLPLIKLSQLLRDLGITAGH